MKITKSVWDEDCAECANENWYVGLDQRSTPDNRESMMQLSSPHQHAKESCNFNVRQRRCMSQYGALGSSTKDADVQ